MKARARSMVRVSLRFGTHTAVQSNVQRVRTNFEPFDIEAVLTQLHSCLPHSIAAAVKTRLWSSRLECSQHAPMQHRARNLQA